MIICCLHIFSISIGTCIRCTFLKNVIAIRLIPEKNIIRQYWIEKECHASKLLLQHMAIIEVKHTIIRCVAKI
jgi:hypothetical protein